jgi:hypothetical protein
MAFRNNRLFEFPEISMGEDQVFLVRNLPHELDIYFSNLTYYTYRVGRPSQITQEGSRLKDLVLAFRLILNESHSKQSRNVGLVSEVLIRQNITLLKRGNLKIKAVSIFYIPCIFRRFGMLVTLHSLKRILKPQVIKQVSRSVYVSLTGGLGNQLFQLAAALSMSRQNKVGMISIFGSPRLNSIGQPDIYDFDYSDFGFEVKRNSPSWLTRKFLGYSLRMGVSPRKLENFRFVKYLAETMASIFVSSNLLRPVSVLIGKGVGFFVSEPSQKARLFVGYFQSYKWVDCEPTLSKLRNLTLKEPTQNYRNYAELANKKEILAVHIRLGDYKSESDFGVLSPLYYDIAIEEITLKCSFDEIWVFSDEPDLAQRNYLLKCKDPVKWIVDSKLSAAETLQLMRHGSGFIIGNSTFSWWAAKLANNVNSPVIVPSKWFKGMTDPVDLIPRNWTKLDPIYVNPEILC